MVKFRTGGSGPDGRGPGWIRGITGRRFSKSGEIYETDDPTEIRILRRCPYVEEIAYKASNGGDKGRAIPITSGPHVLPDKDDWVYSRDNLRQRKMGELIGISRGLYRVGMTKAELINRIIGRDQG